MQIILTFLISLVFKPTFEQVRHKLSAGSEVAIKVLAPITGYFWVSLHYSYVHFRHGKQGSDLLCPADSCRWRFGSALPGNTDTLVSSYTGCGSFTKGDTLRLAEIAP